MQTLKELREKIQALEAERKRLIGEIEVLRKTAEARAATLESEVSRLREEAKSLRELTGSSKVTISAVNVQKPPVSSGAS
ncbi:MAG: hypothetical protein NWF05_10340 [Candidatus Bathyarchaeota archaeon]|nr:hypothetical protein [Candidatus Bathyarchaeota archaeon]